MEEMTPQERKELYRDIQHRVRKLHNKRKEVLMHFIAYSMSMFFIIAFFGPMYLGFSGGLLSMVLSLVFIGWTIGFLIHGVDWLFTELEDRAIQRELDRVGLSAYSAARHTKAKRDERRVRLTDDGELEDFTFYDDSADEERLRR